MALAVAASTAGAHRLTRFSQPAAWSVVDVGVRPSIGAPSSSSPATYIACAAVSQAIPGDVGWLRLLTWPTRPSWLYPADPGCMGLGLVIAPVVLAKLVGDTAVVCVSPRA